MLHSRKRTQLIAAFLIATLAVLQLGWADDAAPAEKVIDLLGEIRPSHSTRLKAHVSGTVTKLFVDIGDMVKPGQALVRIDTPELQARLSEVKAELIVRAEMARAAQAAVTRSETSLLVAKKRIEMARATTRPADSGLADSALADARLTVAQADVEVAKAGQAVAESQVKAAEARVEQVAALLNETEVRSPYGGMIVKRTVDLGDTVRPDAELLELVQIDPVRAVFSVPQNQVIKVGAAVEVTAAEFPGRVFKGRVSRSAHAFDSSTGTMWVEADIPNPDMTISPGLYIKVRVTTTPPSVQPPH